MMIIKNLIDLSRIHFLMNMQRLFFLFLLNIPQMLIHHTNSIVTIDFILIVTLLFSKMNHF